MNLSFVCYIEARIRSRKAFREVLGRTEPQRVGIEPAKHFLCLTEPHHWKNLCATHKSQFSSNGTSSEIARSSVQALLQEENQGSLQERK